MNTQNSLKLQRKIIVKIAFVVPAIVLVVMFLLMSLGQTDIVFAPGWWIGTHMTAVASDTAAKTLSPVKGGVGLFLGALFLVILLSFFFWVLVGYLIAAAYILLQIKK